MKIHEWLAELNSHGIYNAAGCAADFKEKTGLEPCWYTYTVADAKKAIEERGIGGNVSGPNDELVTSGYEIAADLADKHADGFRSMFQGRGRVFFDCLDALKRADV